MHSAARKIRIEKGVQRPRSVPSHPKYPLKDLKVGESFFAPVRSGHMSGSIYLAKLKTGFKYSVRKEGDGCRVWRIA